METAERDKLIARLIAAGQTLAQVQKVLQEEHGVNLTYMDLRLISSELEVNWATVDAEKEAAPDPSDDLLKEPAPASGQTQVTISKVVRPGALMSGDVTFRSGATAEWFLDQHQRLGLNPTAGSAKPTEEDLMEFQQALQQKLQGPM